ncbi:hypothetical protein Bca52824_001558 [Brassica carinata]|uniref:Reverse transcriptase zinc-binding domain-containing protein n=1 Tax=Brassica carinata TaxID=52824 RepID=A0A8X7WGA7_BRACI|nr:hypothetical protein Bca52824_001558 [Brassica carinata]
MIWKLKTSHKIKHFLWQALSDSIATCSRLADRHCGTDRLCPRCGTEEETINHCLFSCPPATQTWALSDIPSSPGSFPSSSLVENFDYLLLRAKASGAPDTKRESIQWEGNPAPGHRKSCDTRRRRMACGADISSERVIISAVPSGCIVGDKLKFLRGRFCF